MPKKCNCRVCRPVCVFEVSQKVPWTICRQCQRNNHRKEPG
jgi:hypothetical protein